MGSFDLSDVKETFVRDVAQLLETLHRATSTLEQPLKQLELALDKPSRNHPLQAIANSAHAVQGTSELLGIKPMGDVARAMQDLAQQGLQTMEDFQQQMALLSAIVSHCEKGTKALQDMLSFELRQEREASNQLAQAWLEGMPQPKIQMTGQIHVGSADISNQLHSSHTGQHHPQESSPIPQARGTGETTDLTQDLNTAFDRSQENWFEGGSGSGPATSGIPTSSHGERLSSLQPGQHSQELLDQGPPDSVGLSPSANEQGFSFFQDESPSFTAHSSPQPSGQVQPILEAAPIPQEAVEPLSQASSPIAEAKEPANPTPTSQASNHPTLVHDVQRAQRVEVSRVEEAELVEVIEQECQSLLGQWTPLVLRMEQQDQVMAALPELLRTCHTLKGSIFTLGLQPTGQLLHVLEDFLEQTTAEQLARMGQPLIHLLLGIHAEVSQNLKQSEQGFVVSSHASLAQRLSQLGHSHPSTSETHLVMSPGGQLQPEQGMELLEHRSVGPAAAVPEASLEDPHDMLMDDGTNSKTMLQISIGQLDAMLNLAGELVVSRSGLFQRLGSLLRLRRVISSSRERLYQMLGELRTHLEFQALDGRSSSRAASNRGGDSQVGPSNQGLETSSMSTSLSPTAFGQLELDIYDASHVVARRLMELVDDISQLHATLFDELVTMESTAENFAGLIDGVQGQIMRARMVPVDSLFLRLQLPIRDAGTKAQRKCRVLTEGSQVLLDKGMADKLYAPMLHLVRNAVAHGLESEAVRLAAGKPAEGTIRMKAQQTSGMTVLEVSDDGAGLNLQALRSMGIARGLLPPNVLLEDPSVAEMVFVTGLSTAKQVSTLSGRGVGCDVVKQVVERMQGQVYVRTMPGQGTTFSIHVPFTLAISRSLLLKSQDSIFAVPLMFCDRIMEPEEARVLQSAGRIRLQIGEDVLPVADLPTLLQLRRPTEALDNPASVLPGGISKKPFVILRVGDERIAVQVDEINGQEDVLVKELGPILQGHPHFSGVTIRADGSLVLILDVASLVEQIIGQQAVHRANLREIAVESPATRVERPSLSAAPTTEGKPLAGKRVLFVDDSLSVRKVADMALRKMGIDVTLAVDGLEGLEKLRSQPFDLVFTDLEMPRMHGYDFLSEIRLLSAFRHLPVVVVTSRSQQKHQDHAKRLGANDYITKPFTADALQTTLERLLLEGSAG